MTETLSPYLPQIWLTIIGFFLLYYAVTDGYDLGVGIISLWTRHEEDRGVLMNAVSPVWHGNQTWLVVLGGMLFGAFPPFYSILLSSLYIPMVVMLFGFVFRGIAFEFRGHARKKRLWSLSFGIGSLVVTLAQGFALGGLLGGLDVRNGRFVGTPWDWVNPYAALVASGVLCGYVMLGANYLILKMEGDLQKRNFRNAIRASLLTLLISAGVHLWTALRYSQVARKWTHVHDSYAIAFFCVLALVSFTLVFCSLAKRREVAPLFWNVAVIIFSFTALSAGLYPDMIPGGIATPVTVREAAASAKTLIFMLGATAVLLPVILTYNTYAALKFRGKV